MRKFVALLAVMAAVGMVAAVPAMAQLPDTSVKVDAKVSPKKAGTKKKPKGINLSGKVTWTTEVGFEPPVITGATVFISKGGRYNGGSHAKCSKKKLQRDGGPNNCPKKSIVGKATGLALADTVPTKPKVVIVNGGATSAFLYTTLYHPALVQEPVPVKIKKQTGKWAYRMDITVPENLLIVAGVPIALKTFNFEVGKSGKRPWAKNYIQTTSCPKGGWTFDLETRYRYNDGSTSSSQYGDSVPCS